MRFLALLAFLAFPVAAQEVEVDVELFLAVDVSRSMSPAELELQRRGYAAALTNPDVIDAITGGLIGVIALTYVEWAGVHDKRVVVPWTLVSDAEDAAAVAGRITAQFEPGLRRTSISSALSYAARSMAQNPYRGLRRVIDISGDGPNNAGRMAPVARDEVLAHGIIINGLPLMTTDALSELWGIPDLDVYYRNCVVGGPGAFVLPVLDWEDFADTVRRKLVLEIAGAMPVEQVWRASTPSYNCRIGEEMWERRRMQFQEP